jgi:DNA-binding NtrC family response regulator
MLAAELLSRQVSPHGPVTLHADGVARLMEHDWPGNVRELRNVLDRAVVLTDQPQLGLAEIDQALHLDSAVRTAPDRAARRAGPGARAPAGDPERDRVLAVLGECGGNQTMAAERLGMSRRALVYRLQAWNMTRPRRR